MPTKTRRPSYPSVNARRRAMAERMQLAGLAPTGVFAEAAATPAPRLIDVMRRPAPGPIVLAPPAAAPAEPPAFTPDSPMGQWVGYVGRSLNGKGDAMGAFMDNAYRGTGLTPFGRRSRRTAPPAPLPSPPGMDTAVVPVPRSDIAPLPPIDTTSNTQVATPPPTEDVQRPGLRPSTQPGAAAATLPLMDLLNYGQRRRVMQQALSAGAGMAGVSPSLGFTDYAAGQEKMRENMLAKERAVTEGVLNNAKGNYFQGAMPVMGADGRVHFVGPQKDNAPSGMTPDEAMANLVARRGGTYTAGEGYRPAPNTRSRDLRSGATKELMARRFEDRNARLAARNVAANEARRQNRQTRANRAAAAQLGYLARTQPGLAEILLSSQQKAADRQLQRYAIDAQMMQHLADRQAQTIQQAADRRLQADQLAIQREFNAGRLTNEQAQVALQRAANERDAALRQQELALVNDPLQAARLAGEAAAAAGLDYTNAYNQALRTAAGGERYMRAVGGQTGAPGIAAGNTPARLPNPEDYLVNDTSVPAAAQQIDQRGGEGTSEWLANLATEMSTPTRNLGLSELGVAFGYPGAWPNRRAAYLASGIMRAYQQGRISDQDAKTVKQVLRANMDPSFLSQLNNPKTENTADVRLLRAVLSGKPISSVGLTPAEVQEIIDTSRFTWLGSPS